MERFWLKVKKTDSCWNWLGAKDKNGYGRITVDKTPKAAHRISWELHSGAAPGAFCVLHTCDNRECVNPGHLYLGSNKDNTQDMVERGRCWQTLKTHCPSGHPYDFEKKYTIWFFGRLKGADGLPYHIKAVREAESEDAAIVALYDQFENVSFPTFTKPNSDERVFVEYDEQDRRCYEN